MLQSEHCEHYDHPGLVSSLLCGECQHGGEVKFVVILECLVGISDIFVAMGQLRQFLIFLPACLLLSLLTSDTLLLHEPAHGDLTVL
jgi:hypothetical protein